jgi:chromosome segregation ATPase
MDIEQLAQKMEWLDEERRKDRTSLAALEDRFTRSEATITTLTQQVKELNDEVARLSSLVGRYSQIEDSIAQLRIEFKRMIETLEKNRSDREREQEKVRLADLESINRSIGEVRKVAEPIADVKKAMAARSDEEQRLNRTMDELVKRVEEALRVDEEYHRQQRLTDEAVKQDGKRITDMAAEIATLRKRVEEQRGRVDLVVDSTKKMETRVSEIQTAESERKQAQNSWMERASLVQVERDRTWKEWQVRFEQIERSGTTLETQLQSMDNTMRALKRAQDSFDEITQRFERRINEITEMQRLADERFRQEWVTFKADDQKRWTNYTLNQDEVHRESTRQFEKLVGRVTSLEDSSQMLTDAFHTSQAQTHDRLQGLLTAVHAWLEEHQQGKTSG